MAMKVRDKFSFIKEESVAEHLEGNIKLIREAGFEVLSSREYPSSADGSRVLAKYDCQFNDWGIVIRDIVSPDGEGTLNIEEIESLSTGITYRTVCNLRGGSIERTRLDRIKQVMLEGRDIHFNDVTRVVKQLSTLLEEECTIVTYDLFTASFLLEGEMKVDNGENSVYIKIGEDEEGILSIGVTNSKHWSNPSQNTGSTTGYFFPFNNVVYASNYVKDLLQQLNTGRQFPVSLRSYEEGYNWMK